MTCANGCKELIAKMYRGWCIYSYCPVCRRRIYSDWYDRLLMRRELKLDKGGES